MAFNSFTFVYFFLIFFLIYYVTRKSLKLQNVVLLIGSYLFYGSWNWKFLPLIMVATWVNYFCSLKIHAASSSKTKKIYLVISIVVSLGILAFFKYANFFVENFIVLLKTFGITWNFESLSIILPIGISFYTFQTMSYTIDVYQGKIQSSDNLLNFSVFVSFFPQLVAGPIERAADLLPQIENKRTLHFDNFSEGLNLVIFGFFKKVVIADNLAPLVDAVFKYPDKHSGLGVILGILAFGFQIYCDFSGYSNIARGIARWMGIRLTVNFNLPYFSKNPAEFWQRWHISLSTWLRDYLFLPVAYATMNKFPPGKKSFAKPETISYSVGILVTMFLGGLWHGASWNFVFWGTFHGLLLVIYRLFKRYKIKSLRKYKHIKPLKHFLRWLLFFIFVNMGWVFFRAPDLKNAGLIFSNIGLKVGNLNLETFITVALLILPLFAFQAIQYTKKDLLPTLKMPIVARTAIYLFLFYTIIIFGVSDSVEFIYFQF